MVIDQTTKLLVHYNMELGIPGEISVFGEWFRLHYLLNPGMAFGLQLQTEYGKMALSLFRLIAIIGIGIYLLRQAKRGVHPGMLWSLALIFGGAIGNAIDSTFYGVLLDNAPANAATPWFHGQVVDMLYFPLFEGTFPEWFPIYGGEYFQFFRPVFNAADASIFMGVCLILIFQKKFLAESEPPQEENVAENPESEIEQKIAL